MAALTADKPLFVAHRGDHRGQHMQLVDLHGFRQQAARWGMRWEQDWVTPRFVWGLAADKGPLLAFDEELRRRGWGWLRDRERNQWDWPLRFPADPGGR